jgi:uncharacterized membrane protein YedE/YeeE
MLASTFDAAVPVLYGALTGLVFGFLLQKGGVTRFGVILGQFLMQDFTVLKVMLTAILVGGAGIYGMRALGLQIDLHVKTAALLAVVAGGLIFGVGMAVLGYCPGTGIAALGDGSRHAAPGILGMLAGGALYAEAFPWLKDHVLGVADLGKETLVTVTSLSPWWFFGGMFALAVVGFSALEAWERRRGPAPGAGQVPAAGTPAAG